MNSMREQIRSRLTVERREDGFRALLNVDSSISVLPDHFPNFPVLPGICLMQAVVIAGAIRHGVEDLRVRSMKKAKMMRPVVPGDQVVIDAEMTAVANRDFLIKAKLSNGESRCAEFSLVAGPAMVAKGTRP